MSKTPNVSFRSAMSDQQGSIPLSDGGAKALKSDEKIPDKSPDGPVVKSEWFLVRKGKSISDTDSVTDDIPPNPPVLKRQVGLMKAGMTAPMSVARAPRGVMGRKLAPVKTKLAYYSTNTGAANASLSVVIPVEPALSTEFASWANLYDECIVHGGAFHFEATINGSGTYAIGKNLIGAIAYDPVNSGAYSAQEQILEASQSMPFEITQQQSGAGAATPVTSANVAVSKTGLYTFRFIVPKGRSARNTATTTNVSGEYSATSDSADTYGWLKPFQSAAGPNNTQSLFGFVVLDVTFRSRS